MAPTNAERIQQLEEQLQAVLNQQTTLQAHNDALQASQTGLEEQNEALRLQVSALTALPADQQETAPSQVSTPEQLTQQDARHVSLAPTTTTNNGRSSEPKVASPEYFTGQRHKLTTFITQVTMVIALQSSRFTTETAKIIYAGSFLRDTAFLWFQPYVAANPKPAFMLDFELFCSELRKTFGDPDEVSTAERQLYALKQRGSVTTYVADFMRHAVIVKWNDDAKAAQFYRGLKDVIKDELSRTGKPSALAKLQEAAIRIDTRLFERIVEKGERHSAVNTTQPRFAPRTTNYPQAQPAHRPTENFRAFGERDSPQLTRKGKLTPAEYQRRKENNLCLYCGDKGHQVLKCPLAPAGRKPVRFQAGTVSTSETKAFQQGKA